jgi:putative heme-binding domain-containing protein
LIGLLTDENLTTITLRQPGGLDLVWPKTNVQSLQAQSWSLMPEGLEEGLTAENMADLLEYIMTTAR